MFHNAIERKALSILLAVSMVLSAFQLAGVSAFAKDSGVTAYCCDSGLYRDSDYKDGPIGMSEDDDIKFRTSVTKVEFKEGTSAISDAAFLDCSSLTDLTIPSSVTSIGEGAFSGCKDLMKISIPVNVTVIGKEAFSHCDNLSDIVFAKGSKLTTIGDAAFDLCSNLTDLTIPSNVTSIGEKVFYGCTDLSEIAVDKSSSKYCSEDGVLFTKDKTKLLAYPADKGGNTYAIPDTVTAVGGCAFCECGNLTDISVPAGVTSVGETAFFDCENLSSITFAEESKLKSIGEMGFCNCNNLTNILLPDSVTTIEDCAFSNCSTLTSIIIPSRVKTLGDQAFAGCNNLTDAVFESAAPPETVGSQIFDDCSDSLTVWVPDEGAVNSYENTTGFGGSTIRFPQKAADGDIFTVGSLRYEVTSTKSKTAEIISMNQKDDFSIPEKVLYRGNIFSVTSIGENAFSRCTRLTEITIPASVTSIGERAFFGCTGLTKITAAEGSKNFYSDKNGVLFTKNQATLVAYPAGKTAEEYSIPSGVTGIGIGAFSRCTRLAELTIPASVTSIGERAFFGCTRLTNITAANGSKNFYSDKNGVLFTKNQATLVAYPAGKTAQEYSIPSGVTGIGIGAFSGCTGLTNITIPSSVKSIGISTFAECRYLTSIIIPSGVKTLGDQAFAGCNNLTDAVFESAAPPETVGKEIFDDCSKNLTVWVPDETAVSRYKDIPGFSGYKISPPKKASDDDIFTDGILIYQVTSAASKTAKMLQCDKNWKGAFSIPEKAMCLGNMFSVTAIGDNAFEDCAGLTGITIPSSVTSISDNAFTGCTGLTGIAIPSSVTAIGVGAFAGCTGLTGITIPDSVKSIADSTFADCAGLTGIAIPDSVKSIGIGAFAECRNLTSITIPSGVKTLDNDAFQMCSNLTDAMFESATPPETVGSQIFDDCSKDLTVWVPSEAAVNSYKDIPGFSGYKISPPQKASDGDTYTYGILTYRVTSAESKTAEIYTCEQHRKGDWKGALSIPEKVPYRGNMFSVTAIADSAFAGCAGLTGITIPDSVKSIDVYAFADCTGLTGITIPASVTSIGDGAFAGCTGLTRITAANGSKNFYTDKNGVLFTKNQATLLAYPAGKTDEEYSIPSGVTGIGRDAFIGCAGLTGITIPNSVTFISEEAFSRCTGLTGITIPNSVTSIGMDAFVDCTGLTSIAIPNSVTSIGMDAFDGCTGLTGITIPSSVTSIVSGTFADCTGLTGITIPSSVASICMFAFEGCTGLKDVILRGASVSLQKYAFYEDNGVSIHFYVPAACIDTYTGELNSDVMGMATAVVTGVKFVSGIGLPKAKDVAYGTKLEDLQLPGTLTLTVDDGSGKDKTETLKNVTWVSSPDYTPETAGTYTFTPVLSSGYLLDGDAAVKVKVKRTEKAITSFKIGGSSGVIDETGHTITVTVPYGTDVTSLKPEISVSDGAAVAPASGTAQDFTKSVAYTVTAENGDTQIYTVTVTAQKSDSDSSDHGGDSSSTPASVSIPAEITDSALKISVGLSGATFPAGITRVTLSDIRETQGASDDPQASTALRLAVSDTQLNVIGTPFLYNLKLLGQNGDPISSFAGSVTVRIPVPAGIHGTPRVYRYEESTKSFTDMNAVVENGFLVFSTTHFSDYIVVGTGDSITLDTRSYRMPAGGTYQIGLKLTGSRAASVQFHSTNDKTASVTKLKNGNYQVKGGSTGTAYIMFDVYDNKNHLLTHASVRVDVKTGIRPRGDSTRQYGVF